jgi:hypothetical protein
MTLPWIQMSMIELLENSLCLDERKFRERIHKGDKRLIRALTKHNIRLLYKRALCADDPVIRVANQTCR